ncbi:AMP-dependent synthetase/ligase [Ferrimonas lipolytica]|uniref:Long-chain fatty acid--CoA ligase n=1 Tax=Ferrimonas lipolytica TaxID=2724191 RepID=A0A6H1UIU0_9GAMM|nr:long-chain fatty acid--CoA ligase [Ferrimonas lipolytica]QIZ78944.1 long-chain fatty acid--CoA ligase [Ferrimonas lipolytica]
MQEMPDAPALRYQSDNQWQDISWQQFGLFADGISRALLALGLEVQDKIAIFAQNSPQWTIADIAAAQIRAVSAPIYPTNTTEQSAYIINDSGAKVLFVAGQEQYQKALAIVADCPQLQHIVLMDKELAKVDCAIAIHGWQELLDGDHHHLQAGLDARIDDVHLDDLFTLIYTSGTTGEPKGVMLDSRNFASAIRQHCEFIPFHKGDVSLAFLPLSHVFERAWTVYALSQGGTNAYLLNPGDVQGALTEVRPHAMAAVPRLYEKIYSAVMDKVNQAPKSRQRLFHWALQQGLNHFLKDQGEMRFGPWRTLKWILADRLVLSKIRNNLGGRLNMMPCGGAALDPQVDRFFQSVGLTVICGYGMTETTATISASRPGNIGIGANGTPLADVEVRISDNDEIQVRGDTVMRGYYNRPDADAEAFTEDGWLRTGDCGRLDERGRLVITDRIKELMKTSNGKYIAPQRVEGMVAREPMVEQVAIIADARNYVSALIVPAFEALEHWAKERNITYKDKLELLENSKVIALFEERLKEVQHELAKFEQVKKFTLMNREFSMKLGEITPTMKLRRKVINQRFAAEIEQMYKKVVRPE